MLQGLGWGFLLLVNLIVSYISQSMTPAMLFRFLIFILLGFFCTHFMRRWLKSLNLVATPTAKKTFRFLGVIVIASALSAVVWTILSSYLLPPVPERTKEEFGVAERLFLSAMNFGWLFLLWSFGYFYYHAIRNAQLEKVNNLRLEAMVKTMELNNIKAHINPHFIFNALNSIRALVDEDPARSRQAITQLSNILRSSLSADRHETVSLEDELNIVSDYLALEQIRFEKRLQVEMDVDDACLKNAVPPMMIQHMVENAVKHGISKRMEGGYVKISAHELPNGKMEVVVKNSGVLQPAGNKDGGFGIKGTKDRLNILYDGRAAFSISESGQEEVESKIIIPQA